MSALLVIALVVLALVAGWCFLMFVGALILTPLAWFVYIFFGGPEPQSFWTSFWRAVTFR